MTRPLILSLMAVSAAWIFLLKSQSAPTQRIPIDQAAARLRQAWADNHTTA